MPLALSLVLVLALVDVAITQGLFLWWAVTQHQSPCYIAPSDKWLVTDLAKAYRPVLSLVLATLSTATEIQERLKTSLCLLCY